MSAPEVTRLSNAPATFEEGGLYPGGKGTITSIRYRLHDYNGKEAPDSMLGVHCIFQPKDGSNEGKPVEVYWSCGSIKEYAPDRSGGFLLAIGGKKGQNNSTNWAEVTKRFHMSCGMPDGSDPAHPCPLDGDNGILALVGTLMTLSRVDQRERDLDERPGQDGGKKRKQTVLVPTWAEFPWEKGGGASKPQPVAASGGQSAAVSAVAPSGPFDVTTAVKAILADAGGTIAKSEIPRKMVEKMTAAGVGSSDRATFMKQTTATLPDGGGGAWMLDGDNVIALS